MAHMEDNVGMRGSRKVCQRGSKFDIFCFDFCFGVLVDEGIKWRFAGWPMKAQY